MATLTNVGKAQITARINGTGSKPQYSAMGTGTADESVLDTALNGTENGTRVTGTVSVETTNVSNDTFQVTATHTTVSGPVTIVECGLFDASTSGNLYVRHKHSEVLLATSDQMTYIYKIVNKG